MTPLRLGDDPSTKKRKRKDQAPTLSKEKEYSPPAKPTTTKTISVKLSSTEDIQISFQIKPNRTKVHEMASKIGNLSLGRAKSRTEKILYPPTLLFRSP